MSWLMDLKRLDNETISTRLKTHRLFRVDENRTEQCCAAPHYTEAVLDIQSSTQLT